MVDMYERNLFTDVNEYSYNFIKTLLEFLNLITDQNNVNTFYMLQWYSLFKRLITTKVINILAIV